MKVEAIHILWLMLLLICISASGQQTAADWVDKGLDLDEQGKYYEAMQAYDMAIAIDPQDVVAWNNKGDVLRLQGKYDEAIEALDKAIKIDPELAVAWYNKGLARDNQGKYDEAIEAYDEAIKLDPQYALAWNNKGNSLYRQGKYNGGVQAYDKAIEVNPKLALAWSNKGVALKKLGLTAESKKAFDRAKELESEGSTGKTTPETTTTNQNAIGTNILDYSMTSYVDESTNNATTRTDKFYNTDSKAYSWLSLGNVGVGTVEWIWYSPDGNQYYTDSPDIPLPRSGDYWVD